jgi:amino acid transporter
MQAPLDDRQIAADVQTLRRMGYAQELLRRMGGFSNFAISFSIICILAGGVTSFSQGFCSVGGASIGIGWPLVCLFSLTVAATMGQVASAFPTAGGLYHWAAILGGRGWGWVTAWFNLLGLITVLAAINSGAIDFTAGWLGAELSYEEKLIAVALLTLGQALFNHFGIRTTTRLTDFSGYWIMLVAILLTAALLRFTSDFDFTRLVSFTNYSGAGGKDVFPATENLALLFALGFLLPAYTLTGFDASAHVAEETVGAGRQVPRAILRSVWVSGLFGWVMLCAVVLAMPHPDCAAAKGNDAFTWTLMEVVPHETAIGLFAGISLAQFLCGLATVTSASRMMYAFARDGGLPWSRVLRQVSDRHRSPAPAIWVTAALAIGFAAIPYSAVAASSTALLYVSYVLPTLLGLITYRRSWTRMGPWHLGRWYRPLAVAAVLGCGGLLFIGVQPPNDIVGPMVGGLALVLLVGWFAYARRKFPGPPVQLLDYEHAEKV